MKTSKLLAGITAAALTAMTVSAAAYAYDLGEKNLGKNWSLNCEIPASAFEELTEDSYVTITFDADQAEEEYWSIKPMDSSWTFIDPNGEGGPELAEGKDAYPVEKEDTSITFKIPADFYDSIKEGGMIIIGHSITLKEMTISDEAPAEVSDVSEPAGASDASEPAGAAGDTGSAPATGDKGNAETGAEGVAAVAAAALIATGTLTVLKRKE